MSIQGGIDAGEIAALSSRVRRLPDWRINSRHAGINMPSSTLLAWPTGCGQAES